MGFWICSVWWHIILDSFFGRGTISQWVGLGGLGFVSQFVFFIIWMDFVVHTEIF